MFTPNEYNKNQRVLGVSLSGDPGDFFGGGIFHEFEGRFIKGATISFLGGESEKHLTFAEKRLHFASMHT